MSRLTRVVTPMSALLIVLAISTSDVHAQCEIGWSNPVVFDWPVHSPRPGVEFDEDGIGPKPKLSLFSGWLFQAGGVLTQGLAGWDGTLWHSFPGGSDVIGNVFAMAVADEDGPGPLPEVLFIGGRFESVGGVAAGKFAKYVNGTWLGTAAGVPAFPFGDITKLISIDTDGSLAPRLFALGNTLCELVEGQWVLVGEVASTDFRETDILAGDLDGPGPEPTVLIRCGYRGTTTQVGEVNRWTGSEWLRLGALFQGQTSVMAMFDSDQSGPRDAELHVGGSFSQVGGQPVRALARWRDGQWQPIEQPLLGSASVRSLAVGDDDGKGPRRQSLFISGNFTVPGATSVSAIGLGRWDGNGWEGLGFSASVFTSGFFVGNLNINGATVARCFAQDPGNYLVRDSTKWRLNYNHLIGTDVTHRVLDLDGEGPARSKVIAAAQYLEAINGGVSKCIAAWDGRRWERLGVNDLNGVSFKAIELFDFDGSGPAPPSLVVAGSLNFGSQRYVAAALIGDEWVPLGSPNTGTGVCLAEFDEDNQGPGTPVLFLGGTFPGAGLNGETAYLLRWNAGIGWLQAAGQLDRAVTDLIVQDDDGAGPILPAMYAAGPMHIGQLAINGIGRWDGNQWHGLVDVVTGEVNTPNPVATLVSLEEEPGRLTLCAGGDFNTGNGLIGAARWRNGRWIPMGSTTTSGSISKMIIDEIGVDSNSTSRLYGVSLGALIRWNGQEWDPLTVGSITINSLSAIDFDEQGPNAPQLVVGGRFTSVIRSLSPTLDALPAAGIATWGARQPHYFARPWDRSIGAGDRLSLKVATGGQEPMTFAWTRDGVTLADGGAVSGATTRELIIDPVMMSDSGQYECIATNACGAIPSGPTRVRVCATLANGDVNADGHVDGLDIPAFVELWTSPSTPASDCAVDLTHNGVRDPNDLAWFIGRLLLP